nr:glutamic acid-rich protein-like [Ipomoea batatas]
MICGAEAPAKPKFLIKKKKMLKLDKYYVEILSKVVGNKAYDTDDVSEDKLRMLSAFLNNYPIDWSMVVYNFLKSCVKDGVSHHAITKTLGFGFLVGELLKSKGVKLREGINTHQTHYYMKSKTTEASTSIVPEVLHKKAPTKASKKDTLKVLAKHQAEPTKKPSKKKISALAPPPIQAPILAYDPAVSPVEVPGVVIVVETQAVAPTIEVQVLDIVRVESSPNILLAEISKSRSLVVLKHIKRVAKGLAAPIVETTPTQGEDQRVDAALDDVMTKPPTRTYSDR